MPFRARLEVEQGAGLPADTRLTAYVVEGRFDDGERRLVARKSVSATEGVPAVIQIDVPRAELNPELGYEMYAALVDSQGGMLMSTAPNRAPVPATGLHFESTFRLRLLPVATLAQREEMFWLPGEIDFDCGGLPVKVRQHDSGRLTVLLPDAELSLAPAVASAGGRFSDGAHEFWITEELQGFLMMPGVPPRSCTRR